MRTYQCTPRIVSVVVGIAILLISHAGLAQEAMTEADQAIKRSEKYDGEALNSQFVAQGVGKRKCIPITYAQASRLLRSPGGAQLSVTTTHRWKSPVTLEGYDKGGIKAYSIEGMVAEQGRESVNKALIPMGPGTIFILIGDVKLLGHTIKAEKSAPLFFVVHNVNNSRDADAKWDTEGPLAKIKFAFDDAINPKPEEQAEVQHSDKIYLQLVYLEGKGSIVLESGKTVQFP